MNIWLHSFLLTIGGVIEAVDYCMGKVVEISSDKYILRISRSLITHMRGNFKVEFKNWFSAVRSHGGDNGKDILEF